MIALSTASDSRPGLFVPCASEFIAKLSEKQHESLCSKDELFLRLVPAEYKEAEKVMAMVKANRNR